MIWADRIAVVLAMPVAFLALIQQPGAGVKWQLLAVFVVMLWLALRGFDFIVTGRLRRS